ncbi:MAG TPA: hypothetical protein VK828_17360 [Terriglobales bacterium]|nr:hypothetical protein [Terriglobales bacterium]
MRPPVQACCVTLAGPHWLGTFDLWWMRSLDGAMRSDGFAVTARLADHGRAWLSWSAPIPDASDSYLAVAAKHAGDTCEPDAHSAKTRAITASQFFRSKEKGACVLIIAKAAAAISRLTSGKEVKT